jgi:glycosyltransferase involved in cell wall biosynthesis
LRVYAKRQISGIASAVVYDAKHLPVFHLSATNLSALFDATRMTRSESTTPLHIAFCITELNVGGAERCLTELATGLDRGRFATSVACLGPRPVGSGVSLVAKLDAAGVPVHYFNASGLSGAPRVLRQLRRQWQLERPDLVQTFLFHANVLGTIAAWRAGVPRIVTGLRVAEPRRRWRRPLERLAGRLTDRHVAVSEGVAKFARERIGLQAERIIVIPNGVSLPSDSLVPADLLRLGMREGRRAMAFVGRLDEQKGVEWLVEQTPELFRQLPQHNLLIIGTGPLEARLRNRVERIGVSARVHFVGWRDDVAAILAAADLLVVPSQWEGMPNVVLEAMAAGRPIVAFDVEGVSDTIGENAFRQVVSRDDRAGFLDRVIEIAVNRALQTSLGRANRDRAEMQFSLEKMIAGYERIYLELCLGPLPSPPRA